tara:strand:- start:294 stop:647 length:354 start_codon:yes stop_codon:yes gene_type:complete
MSDDSSIEKSMEIISLLPDRYYIILRPSGDGEFTLSAYDTTGKKYEKDEDYNPAMVIHEGAIDLIRNHTDDVHDNGLATIQFRITGEEIIEEEDIKDENVVQLVQDNVVRVDFGKKQ